VKTSNYCIFQSNLLVLGLVFGCVRSRVHLNLFDIIQLSYKLSWFDCSVHGGFLKPIVHIIDLKLCFIFYGGYPFCLSKLFKHSVAINWTIFRLYLIYKLNARRLFRHKSIISLLLNYRCNCLRISSLSIIVPVLHLCKEPSMSCRSLSKSGKTFILRYHNYRWASRRWKFYLCIG